MGLSQIEIEALRAMPEFQERLLRLESEKSEAQRVSAKALAESRAHLRPLCLGGGYVTKGAAWIYCPHCGIVYYPKNEEEYQRYARLFLGNHWYHKDGGNPAREDGKW